jgi:hypothetical protein
MFLDAGSNPIQGTRRFKEARVLDNLVSTVTWPIRARLRHPRPAFPRAVRS